MTGRRAIAVLCLAGAASLGVDAFSAPGLSLRCNRRQHGEYGQGRILCRREGGVGRGGLSGACRRARAAGRGGLSGGLTMQQQSDGSKFDLLQALGKLVVWGAWLVYLQHVFLSDMPCGPEGGEMCGISLPVTMEAINLSVNFWFVTPAVFPSLAPVVHPALEGLFNIVVAWGSLFVGFLSDGRRQRVPMLPFMVGTAFLTNVFYLPYLGLRSPNTQLAPAENDERAIGVAESKALPLGLLAVFAASVLWAAFGRGAGGEFGDVATRFNALVDMTTHTDRLAHSFLVDSLTFWAFQGWLVPDDMQRRNFKDPSAFLVAKTLPFFGLVYYLMVRPPLPDTKV